MRAPELKAQLEADWAIAIASNPLIKGLLLAAPKDLVRMAWQDGYMTGTVTTLGKVAEMHAGLK
jgi:hypothetical protein